MIAIDEAELVNVKNCTVAGAGGAKTKVRGIEMRILGAPAFHVYLPTPVTITRLGWTVRAGASTMNDPKYAMVAPETSKKAPLTFIIGRLPSNVDTEFKLEAHASAAIAPTHRTPRQMWDVWSFRTEHSGARSTSDQGRARSRTASHAGPTPAGAVGGVDGLSVS